MCTSSDLFTNTSLEAPVKGFCRWNWVPIQLTLKGRLELAWSEARGAGAPACQAHHQYATSHLEKTSLEACGEEDVQGEASWKGNNFNFLALKKWSLPASG